VGAGDQYANKLEHWFYSLPGFVQSALHEPFTWMNDGLKAVSGQPQELLAAAGHYIDIGEAVQRIGQQQLTCRQALAGHWTGEAYDAFSHTTLQIEQQLDKLAEAIKKAKELLDSGAKACVEGANMIIDIVVTLIMLVLADLAVGAALFVLSAGASAVAMVAKWIAEGLEAVARVARVLQKTAQILKKLADIFAKLRTLFETIARVLKEIKEVLRASKALTKGAKGWDKLGTTVSHGITRTVVARGIWAGTGGTVNIPGPLGSGYKAGKDYVEAWQDADDATDAAGP
jgi:uncharacterized protein YukE